MSASRSLPAQCDAIAGGCTLVNNTASAWGEDLFSNEVARATIVADKNRIGSGDIVRVNLTVFDGFNQLVKRIPGGVATIVVNATSYQAFVDSNMTAIPLLIISEMKNYSLAADITVSALNRAYLPNTLRSNNISVVRQQSCVGGRALPFRGSAYACSIGHFLCACSASHRKWRSAAPPRCSTRSPGCASASPTASGSTARAGAVTVFTQTSTRRPRNVRAASLVPACVRTRCQRVCSRFACVLQYSFAGRPFT